jgi:hypothetical protein
MKKNFVLFAPIFPETFYQFAIALKNHGCNVLVIGDKHQAQINPALQANIDAYYYVHDLHQYTELHAAMDYFIARFGAIDYIESNIEYWLKTDAYLREKYDIENGLRPEELLRYQQKSSMKSYYKKAGIPFARFTLVSTLDDALVFVHKVGYPVFVKPDMGVGSQRSYKLINEAQLRDFFIRKPLLEVYILEEYIDGDIYSFDGMANAASEVVFYTAHYFPNNIASIVNEDAETYYLTLKQDHIPLQLIEYGKKTVAAFALKKRFFHLEFFCLNRDYPHLGRRGDFIALEANLRPPGGFSLEMINHANSVNSYQIYAYVMLTDHSASPQTHPQHYCGFASRKNHHQYRYNFDTIRHHYQSAIVFEHDYPYPISLAMGDYFFLGKFQTYEAVQQFFQFVLAK